VYIFVFCSLVINNLLVSPQRLIGYSGAALCSGPHCWLLLGRYGSWSLGLGVVVELSATFFVVGDELGAIFHTQQEDQPTSR